jgi:hypothetical protein
MTLPHYPRKGCRGHGSAREVVPRGAAGGVLPPPAEGQSFWIKGRLCLPQGLAGGGDVLPILFGRVDTPFLTAA